MARAKTPQAQTLDASLPPADRILSLLGLERATSFVDLQAMVLARFRAPQQMQLAAILQTMQVSSPLALGNVAARFSRCHEVKEEVERYLQDLIRMHHYIAAHDRQHPLRNAHLGPPESPERGGAVTRTLMHLFAAFADSRDRHLLTKIYQTLGLSRAVTYCFLAKTLPLKYQKELLNLFAEDLPELRVWIHWLDGLEPAPSSTSARKDGGGVSLSVNMPSYEIAINFMGRTIRERCMPTWLELLRPLDTASRLQLIDAIQKLPIVPPTGASSTSVRTLKKLGRFYETTALSVLKLLDLDIAVRHELPLLLEEFPTITLLTLFAKFNSEKMIQLVVRKGLPYFPKSDLLKLLDALAPAEVNAIEVFVVALFGFRKKIDFLLMFLNFSIQNQLRFLDLMVATANADVVVEAQEEVPDDFSQDQPCSDRSCLLFKLFLDASFTSLDTVIQKLATLPKDIARQMVHGMANHSKEELVVLGQGLELVELPCLQHFLRLFLVLQPELREILVAWVEEMPGEDTLPVYDTLLDLHAGGDEASGNEKVSVVLQMLSSLKKKDKVLLCREILDISPAKEAEGASPTLSAAEVHVKILTYLCECELSRHKVLRLLRVIPFVEYDRLIFLLRTQRMPEQVALTRLMLSMPSDANCRLLARLAIWSTDALDAFFQLLLMLPKVEYKMFAKLMASSHVSAEELEAFVMVAVDMMNQASSRELVIFTAELPVHIRKLFFSMLEGHPEKGVLLRIISYSARVAPDLMHVLVELFSRMSWEIRSAFVEQLRSLDGASDVENLAEVARNLEDDTLRNLVTLFNPLPVHVRVGLVGLFLQLNVRERFLTLTRLVEMPKGIVGAFCATICSPKCATVSASFCRILGLVNVRHQLSLLRLLKSEPLWFFLQLMAGYCETSSDSAKSEQNRELLNRMAELLELFTLDEHYLVLREVVRDALANAMALDEVVSVLALFPDAAKLLDFLRYVNRFSRYTRSSLLFHVLSKYQQPAFIFDMCRILDLDDAVFALKRLDRMWQRRHIELDEAMTTLALLLAEGNIQAKDEFCDLIVGFRSRAATFDEQKDNEKRLSERIITPRCFTDPETMKTGEGQQESDNDQDAGLCLPTGTPPSHRPVPLDRHLHRTRPDQAFPRKRSDRKAWWQDLDEITALFLASGRQGGGEPLSSRESVAGSQGPESSDDTLPSVFALTESNLSEKSSDEGSSPIDSEDTPITASKGLLPHIGAFVTAAQDTTCLELGGELAADSNHSSLCRSESAPTMPSFQEDSEWNKRKRYRGLTAALDKPVQLHVGRDRGSSLLQKQYERLRREGDISRIQHAKTPGAQALIMEARVWRGVGRRPPAAANPLSPLARPDRYVVEHATDVLATSVQFRAATPQGFIWAPPVRSPAPVKHHQRVLPGDTAPIRTTKEPTNATDIQTDMKLSNEPVAPW